MRTASRETLPPQSHHEGAIPNLPGNGGGFPVVDVAWRLADRAKQLEERSLMLRLPGRQRYAEDSSLVSGPRTAASLL